MYTHYLWKDNNSNQIGMFNYSCLLVIVTVEIQLRERTPSLDTLEDTEERGRDESKGIAHKLRETAGVIIAVNCVYVFQ